MTLLPLSLSLSLSLSTILTLYFLFLLLFTRYTYGKGVRGLAKLWLQFPCYRYSPSCRKTLPHKEFKVYHCLITSIGCTFTSCLNSALSHHFLKKIHLISLFFRLMVITLLAFQKPRLLIYSKDTLKMGIHTSGIIQ